jgi:hypothetical protein
MDFTPYPYGNAKRSSSGQITCQHGSAECIGKAQNYPAGTRTVASIRIFSLPNFQAT